MYLKKTKTKNGRIYLSICESYRLNGKSRTRTIEKCGYLDELEQIVDSPIAHFEQRARDLTRQKERSRLVAPRPQLSERIQKDGPYCIMLGTLPISRIYHQLELDKFWQTRRGMQRLSYSPNQVFRMLVYGRIIHPTSMIRTWEKRALMPDRCDFSREELCESIAYLARYENLFRSWIEQRSARFWSNDQGGNLYCGITSYYFALDERSSEQVRAKRTHRNPIVQTALLLDADSSPIDYEVFTGSVKNPLTLMPVIKQLKGRHHGKRFVIVMDQGLSVEENLSSIVAEGDGFIFNQSIRRAGAEKQNWILDRNGYERTKRLGLLVKSRITTRRIVTAEEDGSMSEREIPVREIAFWSRRLATHAKEGRARILEKNQGVYGRARRRNRNAQDPASDDAGPAVFPHMEWQLDWKRIEAEERSDGYNCIVTSETDTNPLEILEEFIGLWQTESLFHVAKSAYNDYPLPVSRENSIRVHFMMCFTSLTILRIMQKLTGNKYSISQISSELKHVQGYAEDANWYLFSHRTDLLDDVGRATGVDMTRRRLTRAQIKQMLAETKRPISKNALENWTPPTERSILIFDISALEDLDYQDGIF